MSKKDRINVAIVGLGFGAEFIPIYQRHPQREHVRHLPARPEEARTRSATPSASRSATRISRTLLKDPKVDAVHINSPIPDHGWMSIAALKAGKHVACTVPMATSIEDCKKIVDLVKKTGLKYMMMETVVYAREYLFMKELLDKGEARASCSSSRRATSRTWTAGRTTGPACRRCGTPRTASGPCSALAGAAGGIRVAASAPARSARNSIEELRLALRRRDRAHQVRRTPTSARASSAASSTPRGSIARASTSTAARSPSSGR